MLQSAYELQEPSSAFYSASTRSSLTSRLDKLTSDVRTELKRQGFQDDRIKVERTLNMRFEGTDTSLMVLPEPGEGDGKEDFEAAFNRAYKAEFGFLLETKTITVDDIKVCLLPAPGSSSKKTHFLLQVRGIGKTFDTLGESVFSEVSHLKPKPVDTKKSSTRHSVYFDKIGRVDDTPIFLLDRLDIGEEVRGPAMIIDDTQTIVVVPGAKALLTRKHLYITLD